MMTDRSFIRLAKRTRSSHIHRCRRREVAKRLGRKQNEVLYCYFCFEWVQSGRRNWTEHCAKHLQSLGSLDCDRVTYGSSEIKPYRCAACVEDVDERNVLREYTPHDFWKHVERDHIGGITSWPRTCIYYGCSALIDNKDSLWVHLVDTHYHSKRTPTKGLSTSNTGIKRPRIDDETMSISVSSIHRNEEELLDPSCQWASIGPPSPISISTKAEDDDQALIERGCRLANVEPPSRSSVPSSLIDPALVGYGDQFRSSLPLSASDGRTADSGRAPIIASEAPGTPDTPLVPEKQAGPGVNMPAQEREDEWPVESLLAKWKNGKSVFYLVKWKGFGDEENSWVSNKDIGREAVAVFESTFKGNDTGIEILDKRLVRNKRQYYVSWRGRPLNESSWESVESISRSRVEAFEDSFGGHDVGVTLTDKRAKAGLQVQYCVKWAGRPARENCWVDESLIGCRKRAAFEEELETGGHKKRRK